MYFAGARVKERGGREATVIGGNTISVEVELDDGKRENWECRAIVGFGKISVGRKRPSN